MPERMISTYELKLMRAEWKPVCEECLNENDRIKFQARKTSVDMYIEGYSLKEISEKSGIHISKINVWVKKCLALKEDNGEQYGYAALIPNFRVKKYTKTNETNTSYFAGSFGLLISEYPSLKSFIYNNYFRKDNVTLEKNINVQTLYSKFIEECRRVGIQDYEYPFNTIDKAERTFYKYIKELRNQNVNDAINRENQNAQQRFKSTGLGMSHRPIPITPLSVVQIDGHKIDMLYTVNVQNKHGEIIQMPATRMWLIAVIDVATRVILGYSLTPNENYNQIDVLRALKNSIIPKKKINFTLGGFSYPENGGYASLAIPEIEWAMFDTIMLDNAKSHLASNVIDKLCGNLMCNLNFGSVATPETRGVIERVFETLEENGFHRLPSTTGSNINDNRRRNAEKDAIKYSITYDDIAQLTEYFIAIYNNSSHKYLDNQTPLQCMQRRIYDAGMMPYIANEEQKAIIASLTNQYELKTIRGKLSSGKRPYITYKGVEYRNDLLAYSTGLIGQKIMLEINPDDIRTVKAYFFNGAELGILTAMGEWGRKSHSLKTREAALKLANTNKQKNNRFYAPLSELEKELDTRAKTERRARTKADILKKEIKNSPNTTELNHNNLNSNITSIDKKRVDYTTAEQLEALLSADSVEDAYKKGLI